jgi:hypothetical protein
VARRLFGLFSQAVFFQAEIVVASLVPHRFHRESFQPLERKVRQFFDPVLPCLHVPQAELMSMQPFPFLAAVIDGIVEAEARADHGRLLLGRSCREVARFRTADESLNVETFPKYK